MSAFARTRGGGLAVGAVAAIAVLTLAYVVLHWPAGGSEEIGAAGVAAASESAEVTLVEEGACPGGDPQAVCATADVRIDGGAEAGETVTVLLGASAIVPDIEPGDAVKVARNEGPPGADATYTLTDFQRGAPMTWLAIAFCLLVVAFGRLRGALSLVGLLASLVVVLVYVVPAIRDGEPELGVALSGAMAVMLVTITLAHGVGAKSVAAMLGTAASLLLVVILASVFTEWAHLTGFSSEEASYLAGAGSEISVQGLLLAGMVIGALGVLDDVTISQSSTVMALRAANPELSVRELYGRALEVGRDHVSATVNTLVLAYVGASLPILLIFSSGDIGFADAINVEVVATQVVATLVGSIGLIAAVPLTTLLAAALAARLPAATLARESEHAHVH